MAQIFLSYSRQDAEVAKALASGLGRGGHELWWDKHISGGSRFAAEIEQALGAAQVVIVLWSAAAVSSPWVLDEAAEGRDTGRLLPISIDGCKPPLGFRQFQTISVASTRVDGGLDEILQAIARRSGEQHEAAGQSTNRSSSSDPDGIEALCSRARQLENDGQFEEAQRQIEAALELDQQSWLANSEAGRLLYMQARPADAVAFYEKAVALMKSDHESAAMLISCFRATDNDPALRHAAEITVARAEHAIASALPMGPAFASGAKGLAALSHADRARRWLRKAVNTEPGNLQMRYTLAGTLAAFLDDPEAAMDLLEPFVESANNRTHLQLLEFDPDWSSIRELGAFQSLVRRARKRVEALEATGRG